MVLFWSLLLLPLPVLVLLLLFSNLASRLRTPGDAMVITGIATVDSASAKLSGEAGHEPRARSV